MNSIGIKRNRKPMLIGIKIAQATKMLGKKNVPSLDNIVSKGNADISNIDSNIIDSQKMYTGLNKSQSNHSNKNGLEKGNRQTE